MSDDMIEHNFNFDLENDHHVNYPYTDLQWIYINDINQNNYPTGFINFTNTSMVGNAVNKFFDWGEAYVSIPYSITADLTKDDATDDYAFDTASGNSFKNALALKGLQHVVDWVSLKFNGVAVNRNSYYTNFYINEQIKKFSNDEHQVVGDLLCHAWDEGRSINWSSGVGEYNNRVTGSLAFSADVDLPNRGHSKRCSYNSDMANNTYSSIGRFTGMTGAGSDLLNVCQQSGVTSVSATNITYNGVANIPLRFIHPFFEKAPAVASSVGFEVRLQSNIASENSYVLKYSAGTRTLASVTANQVVGHTCPYMISPLSVDGASGIDLNFSAGATASNDYTITLKSKVGWSAGGNPPCRIYVPAISYSNPFTKKILDNPRFTMNYRDWYVDQDLNKGPTDQVSRLFNVQIAKCRTLYIMPFLAVNNTAGAVVPCSPYLSPVSSAPNTVTPCKLKNLQIQIGGINIFNEAQNMNVQFYQNSYMRLMAHINGNALKGLDYGCQITKSMFDQGGYNVYAVNLKKVADEVQDSIMKSFQLMFQVDSVNANIRYDFLYIIDYDTQLDIDRSTGEVTAQ